MSGLAEERLEVLAEHLRLPDLPVLLPQIAEAAVAGEHSYARFTVDLLAACAATADERAAETIARLAGFPARKTLADFDFGFQASINKRQVGELASCAFVERAENVVLLGPPGVGKTHLAIALGLEAAGRRYSVKFTTAARMVATLVEARGAGSFTRRLAGFCRPRLLIVDEVGFCRSRPRARRCSSRSWRGATSTVRSSSPPTRATANGRRCSAATR